MKYLDKRTTLKECSTINTLKDGEGLIIEIYLTEVTRKETRQNIKLEVSNNNEPFLINQLNFRNTCFEIHFFLNSLQYIYLHLKLKPLNFCSVVCSLVASKTFISSIV